VLATHASPGSQTAGLPADLDAALTVQRVTRTDARVICCGHTHVADVRELGRKLLVNPGSCGYAFDGSPDACWGMVTLEEEGQPQAELHRASYDPHTSAEEVAARGLPGDVYRAATIRTGRFVR
jgi:diadenosine tetraphosphatase ApaH/serine/threonine PP2A family protein phosphatase